MKNKMLRPIFMYDVIEIWPTRYGVPSVQVRQRRWLVEAGARLAKSDDVAGSEEDEQNRLCA